MNRVYVSYSAKNQALCRNYFDLWNISRLSIRNKIWTTKIAGKTTFRLDWYIFASKLMSIFTLSKPKVIYLRLFSSSLPFLKFWKENFMYFGHKHVETGPNCSHELATFFKYHMPLRKVFMLLNFHNCKKNSK